MKTKFKINLTIIAIYIRRKKNLVEKIKNVIYKFNLLELLYKLGEENEEENF